MDLIEKTVTELFLDMAECMSSVVRATEDIFGIHNSLKESSMGKVYVNSLNAIMTDFQMFSKTLQKRIDNNEKPDKTDLSEIIKYLDQVKGPEILGIMSIVFKGEKYDEQDKQDVHKICTIYDQMYQEFEHNVYLVRLKYVDLRDLNMKGFKLDNRRN